MSTCGRPARASIVIFCRSWSELPRKDSTFMNGYFLTQGAVISSIVNAVYKRTLPSFLAPSIISLDWPLAASGEPNIDSKIKTQPHERIFRVVFMHTPSCWQTDRPLGLNVRLTYTPRPRSRQ